MQDKDKAVVLSKAPIAFALDAAGLEHFFRLEHWRVRCGTREDSRIVWIRGEFVLVVAITPEQMVVTLREYKQAAEMALLGLPAGGIKRGETPQAAALRELGEETGYSATADRCHVLGPFLNSPDKSTEKHYVVLVLGATKSGQTKHDETETILAIELLDLASAKREIKIGLHRLALQEAHELLTSQNSGKQT